MINFGNIMFNDPVRAALDIFFLSGIVLALFAARGIKTGTRELHARNLAARHRLNRHYKG